MHPFNMGPLIWMSVLVVSAFVRQSDGSCSQELEQALEAINCTCDKDNKIGSFAKCIDTNLVSFPTNLPDNTPLHGIHFAGNPLKNCLERITYNNLEKVIMSNNDIKCIPKGVFSNLAQVETMVLSNNSFQLEANTFQGMSSLKVLILDGNPLHHLLNLTFSGNTTQSLERLSLANCHIYEVEFLAFYNMHELNVLNMSNNRLTKTFNIDNAATLNTLDLSFNKISDLSDLPFDGLQKVITLHLDHNVITSLSASVFQGLENLRHLSVSFNQLADIHPSTFDAHTLLQTIRLDHNELTTLELNEEQMNKLETLTVHHNRWKCDCKTSWMRDQKTVKEFNHADQMMCDSPADVAGQSLYDVDIHKFDCPDPHHGLHSNTVALAMGIIVSLLVVVAISFMAYHYVVKNRIPSRPSGNRPTTGYREVDWAASGDNLADRMENRII